MTELQSDMVLVAVTQENVVIPRLTLLAEGHETLLHTLAPVERVEAVEEDVTVLKGVARSHTAEIAALKKAQ